MKRIVQFEIKRNFNTESVDSIDLKLFLSMLDSNDISYDIDGVILEFDESELDISG